MKTGIIRGFRGSWSSGIGLLMIQDSNTGEIESVPCENASTIRALDDCFGNIIEAGNVVSQARFELGDLEIDWDFDDLGIMLGWFSPVGDGAFRGRRVSMGCLCGLHL